MSSHVNLLKHSPNISDLARRNLSFPDLSHINGKLARKQRRELLQQCFELVNSLTSKGCSEEGAFGDWRNYNLRWQ